MISALEVAPASGATQMKVVRVPQKARKQLVFRLVTDRGEPYNLHEEVQTPPAAVSEVLDPIAGGTANLWLVAGPSRESWGTPPTGEYSNELFKFATRGTILDQSANRGFVSFNLTPEMTSRPGIVEAAICLYAASGTLVETWPALIAVEPPALALLDTYYGGPLLLPEIRLSMLDLGNSTGGAPFSSLLDDVEFSDLDLVLAMRRCVQLWNETPPMLMTYTVDSFPYRYWWLEGTVGHLLTSGAQRYLRNTLQYSAGGVTIDDQNKWQQYLTIGQQKMQSFMDWMRTTKYAMNMDRAWSVGL